MEGTGSNYSPERRAARILDFDLKKEPEPEPEPVAEQERHPQDEALEVLNPDLQPSAAPRIRVIHNVEENPEVDVLFDISNVEQNMVDMIVNSSKFAREGKVLQVQSAKIHEDGGVSVSLRLKKITKVDGNNSSADKRSNGAKESSGFAGRKRERSDTDQDHIGDTEDASSSSNEVRFGPPKIKWKSQDEEGDAQIQGSWTGEQ